MAVITLTGHLGSMGTIGSRIAASLGYMLADRELLLEAAAALGWSEPEVAAFDERTDGQGGRLARFLSDLVRYSSFSPLSDVDAVTLGTLAGGSYGEWAQDPDIRPPDRRYLAAVSAVVRGLAERGDAVIVGRGSQALLAGRPDTIHVRVVCELEERVRRIARRDGTDERAARARVVESDRQRSAWHRKYFNLDYESPDLYHLVVNSGRLSDETAADVVAHLVTRLRAESGTPPAAAGSAEPATQRQDWGWIELVDRKDGAVLARAHLFATRLGEDGTWDGQLESVRLSPGVEAVPAGSYFARFALSGTDHIVTLEVDGTETRVHGTDAQVPAIFSERSGG